jgi:hypothetical protein
MLPPCIARRFLPDEPGVYYCAHPQHHSEHERVTAEVCAVCPLWSQPPPASFRPFPPPPLPALRGKCLYLGKQVGTRKCPTCRGTVRQKVFACSHPDHKETVLTECAECADFVYFQQSQSTE